MKGKDKEIIWLQQCDYEHLGTMVSKDGTPVCAICGTKFKVEESNIPDWEIISYFHNSYRWSKNEGLYWNEFNNFQTYVPSSSIIQSVRRKMDGVEFQIGDRICSKVNIPNSFTIEKIQIINDNFIYLDSCPLENAFHLGKPKVPLFTLENVDIYEGDTFYSVNKKGLTLLKWIAYSNSPHQWSYPELEYFSSEEKAKRYIHEHKPTEVLELYKHDVFERGVDKKKYCYVLTLSKPLQGSNGQWRTKIEEVIKIYNQ